VQCNTLKWLLLYIHLYAPHNMAAQANKTGTSKNTTNETEKVMTAPLYTCQLCNIKYTMSTTKVCMIFTALHVMQTRYCDENSVCPAVCPSVRLSVRLFVTRVYCDKTVETSVQIYNHTKEHLA